MNTTEPLSAVRELLAQAWREGVQAQSPEYAVNPYETTMNDARIRAALNPKPTPYEDDFGDASIGRVMRAARDRGEDIENMPNPSRLRPTSEGSPS